MALTIASVEVSGGSYARIGVANDTSNRSTPASGLTHNALKITFIEATGTWGTVDGVQIMSASTGGYIIASGDITTPILIPAGVAPFFNATDLVVSVV